MAAIAPAFQEPQFSANRALVDGLRTTAARQGKTAVQLAIAWVLQRPEVTSTIVGARKPSHIKETVKAGDWELDARDTAEIKASLAERDRTLDLA